MSRTFRPVLLSIFLWALGWTLDGWSVARAADEFDANEVLFARRISGLLVEKCVACHGGQADEIQGGLDLRTGTTAQRGDSDEALIHPGDADGSPLFQAASRNSAAWSAMPPKDAEQLNAEQLGWLRQWIEGGAKWIDDERIAEITAAYNDQWSVEDGVIVKTSGGLDDNWTNRRYDPDGLWAYQPVERPNLDPRSLQLSPIDQLLQIRRPEGLPVAAPAERAQWLRRATFDLTGLPPHPAEVAEFVNDSRCDDEAYAAAIDRLLASPHYGERMAQHWLDVVRYADSSGFANDYERGNAWRYRDYVIRSFNADKPYDQFIIEQIAGDEIDPTNPEAIVATGFLRMGPWELTGMEVAKVARQRFLDDVTNSVGETFLGHSLQCARCHDHKFDPIPTRDYYALQAVFATTQLSEREAAFLDEENTDNFDERKYLEKRKQEHEQMLAKIDLVLLENAEQWFEREQRPSDAWRDAVEFVKKKNDGKVNFSAVRNRMAAQGFPQEEYPSRHVGLTPDQFGIERVSRKGIQRLAWELDRYRPFALAVYNGRTPQVKSVDSPTRVPTNRLEEGELEKPCILTGGDPFAQGAEVEPGALSVLDDQLPAQIGTGIEGRRTALTNWIANARNPLTTRVIVNRLWQWHFGRAIAGNPNNFGATGKRPTHPQLLNYLAARLVENGWQIKSLHREIMLSQAYRQSTTHPHPEQVAELDPMGEAYCVFPRRRLTAEELRDAMLAVSGEWNPKLGGIPVRPEINSEVALQPRQVMGTFAAAWTPNPQPEDRHRRSIYVLKLRGVAVPLLDVFNAPMPDFSCERRESSTVTPQVFALWNSQDTYSRALSLAISVTDRTHLDAQSTLRECFLRLYARQPTDQELAWCVAAWQDFEAKLSESEVASIRNVAGPPTEIVREAVEENTGEHFTFAEPLHSNHDFTPDHDPNKLSRRVIALADVCLALLNTNEFVYLD
ncbi:MAG: PSD1 and planctomycete cytochrome C domain-containing protein [Pirellulaceae bacterium]